MQTVKTIVLLLYFAICSIEDVQSKRINLCFCMAAIIAGIIFNIMDVYCGNFKVGEKIPGLIPGILLMGLAYLTKEAIGYGDGISVVILGMFMDFYAVMGVVLTATMMAAIVYIVLLALRKVNKKSEIAFIPYLTLGVLIGCVG